MTTITMLMMMTMTTRMAMMMMMMVVVVVVVVVVMMMMMMAVAMAMQMNQDSSVTRTFPYAADFGLYHRLGRTFVGQASACSYRRSLATCCRAMRPTVPLAESDVWQGKQVSNG